MPAKKTTKKATKKKAARKAAKHDAAAKRHAAKKRHESLRRKLVDKFAGDSASMDAIDRKFHDVTGRHMTNAERSQASIKLAEKVLRGGKRR